MPDKNPDASPAQNAREPKAEMLEHHPVPALKHWAKRAIALALLVACAGIGLRLYHSYRTARWTDDQAVPTVQLIHLTQVQSGGTLDLPANVEAFTTAPIYAQVSGYVQKWYVDIGSVVKRDQILAQIDPRPYQAALDQAKGALARDSATLANAKVDLERYRTLAAQNAVSDQQLVTQQATVTAQSGVVEADKAAVKQASINLAYTTLSAPFDGIVTTRAIDIGNLVTVGTQNPTPLFTVSDQSRMRIYVRVPQNYATTIRPDMAVSFTVPQYLDRRFTARLVGSASAVDNTTGTVLVQFGTDNKDGALKPGNYAQLNYPLPAGANGIRLPATALLFRDEGMQVATVDPSNHVRLKTVTIQRDYGNAVDVGRGVTMGERIIDNPTDSLRDGDLVRIANR